jgi:hypothetical protein
MVPAVVAVLFLLPILHSDAIPVYGRRRRAHSGDSNGLGVTGATLPARQAVWRPVVSGPPGNGT